MAATASPDGNLVAAPLQALSIGVGPVVKRIVDAAAAPIADTVPAGPLLRRRARDRINTAIGSADAMTLAIGHRRG
jgi:hypothetical protein